MSPPLNLAELDSLMATIIIDNEIDVLSTTPSITQNKDRGEAKRDIPMEAICCGAHGLSVLVISLLSTKGTTTHSNLFDTGPEVSAWKRNATRLGIDLASIGAIQLSHWHRDHSSGMLKAFSMITAAKTQDSSPVIVDLHPSRPNYRGLTATDPLTSEKSVVLTEADPSFVEIEQDGGVVRKDDRAHTLMDGFFGVSGEIPRVTGYEKGLKGGVEFISEEEGGEGTWTEDEQILDERFLIYKGMNLFTARSHGGVVNAARHSLALINSPITPKIPLYAILGGYHLVGEQEANIPQSARDLKELDPKVLLPGHCSGWRAMGEIKRNFERGVLVPCTVDARFEF
ncbi:related to metallo-beta-lactamase superfamily protein [Rhynchosporium graminicola]|uniref:Related to metallo-beta-lactamase superfamily protein n=1 Tax=Rhynchosporium graminicola TaxID=2792576 RepID=A0A1E1L743_9HELO|nr:related to metallo-beta-lactamase superfamily protein [Rhynchosporium commune]